MKLVFPRRDVKIRVDEQELAMTPVFFSEGLTLNVSIFR